MVLPSPPRGSGPTVSFARVAGVDGVAQRMANQRVVIPFLAVLPVLHVRRRSAWSARRRLRPGSAPAARRARRSGCSPKRPSGACSASITRLSADLIRLLPRSAGGSEPLPRVGDHPPLPHRVDAGRDRVLVEHEVPAVQQLARPRRRRRSAATDRAAAAPARARAATGRRSAGASSRRR